MLHEALNVKGFTSLAACLLPAADYNQEIVAEDRALLESNPSAVHDAEAVEPGDRVVPRLPISPLLWP